MDAHGLTDHLNRDRARDLTRDLTKDLAEDTKGL